MLGPLCDFITCHHNLLGERYTMSSTPVREFRPVVVPTDMLIAVFPCGFISIFPAFFTFVISNMLSRNRFDPVFGMAIGVYCVAFAATMVFAYLKVFQEPGKTVYRLYPERLEFFEGMFTRVQRTVLFDNVLEVQLTEGVLQRGYGAGTISLVTRQLVSRGEGQMGNRTIHVRNIPQPQAMYDQLRTLVKPDPHSP